MHTPTTERPKAASSRPHPHATSEEMDQRLDIMRIWRVEGMSRQEVKHQAIAYWNVSTRTAQLYVRKVEQSLGQHARSGDELVNLELSQLMRDRLLKELSHRLVGANGMETKELLQIVNATRTLLDSRDRTVRTMHSMRGK